MAIRHSITLSTSEPNNEVGNLKIRQGDEQTQTLVANITENGVPKPFTGLQPFFCAKLGQTAGLGIIEQKVTGPMNPANGTLEYVMQPEDWQQLGRQTAYFSFRKMVNDHEWTEQFSTRDFNYNVIKSAFSEGLREVKKDGSTYVWTIEDMIRYLQEFMDSGRTDFDEWYEEIKDNLSEDAAGNLMLLYQALRDKTGKDSDFRGFESEKSFMQRVYNEQSERGVNIKWFGAKGDYSEDCTDIIQNLIDNYNSVFIPKGKYKILGTIKIRGENKTLYLAPGAILEKPVYSDDTNPIIHMTCSFSSVRGDGQGTAIIRQLCDSPRGIVSIGDLDHTDPLTGLKSPCVYNTLTDCMLWGKGSNNTGNPNFALYMSNINDDESSIFSYYHNIRNLQIRYANVGIGMLGWSNANLISGITFTAVGNEKYFENVDSAILMKEVVIGGVKKVPLDNSISNTFHTGSKNAITMLLDGQVRVNSFTNIVSEPGGENDLWLKTVNDENAVGNIIIGVDNVRGGSHVSDTFHSRNTVMYGQSMRQFFNDVTLNKLTTKDKVFSSNYDMSDNTTKLRKYTLRQNLEQNKTYRLFEYDLTASSVKKFIFDVKIVISRGVEFIRKTGGFKFSVDSSGKVAILEYYGEEPIDYFYFPEVVGTKVFVYIKIPNNATSQTVSLKNEVTVDSFDVINETDLTMQMSNNTFSPTTNIMYLSESGSTSKRYAYKVGQRYLDTTLNKPIWWNGIVWVDANGTAV